MIKIKVNIRDEVSAHLGRLVEIMRDTTPLMREIAQTMQEAVDEAFDRECDPVTGAAWPELTKSYREQRAEAGHDGKMLQLSGALATSILKRVAHNVAQVGTNKPYAAAHQFGAKTGPHEIRARHKRALRFRGKNGILYRKSVKHPGSNIPARPYLGVGPEHKEHIESQIMDRLASALKGA
jgi:phage virion morphogenesis protein